MGRKIWKKLREEKLTRTYCMKKKKLFQLKKRKEEELNRGKTKGCLPKWVKKKQGQNIIFRGITQHT